MKEEKEKIRLVTIFLGIFLIVIPLDSLQIFGRISILRIFAIIPIILSVFYTKEYKINKKIAYLIVFIIYIFIQIFYTIETSVTIAKLKTFSMFFLLLFLCTSIKYNKREIKFLNRMFAYSTILAAVSLLIWGFYENGRLTVLINPNKREDENQFCGYFIVGIIYFIKNVLEKKHVIVSMAFIGTFLFIALLTGSRGGLLAIILSIITYLFFYSKNNKKSLKKTVLALFIGAIIIILTSEMLKFLSPEIAERFSIKNVQESGGTGRVDIWKYYLKVYSQSSILKKGFGYGAGTTSLYIVAHNNWLEVLIENGIVGLFIYLQLIISFVIDAYKRKNIYLFSVFIGYITLTLSLSLFSYKPIWAIMLLILLKEKKNVEDI